MILTTLHPFSKVNNKPFQTIRLWCSTNDIQYFDLGAKLGRKPSKNELIDLLLQNKVEGIISGTEIYDQDVLEVAHNLKIISRAGIGVDNVDLEYCRKKGITVTNTPDAPSQAVAELTICQIINMLRKVQNVDVKYDKWNRYIGRQLSDCIVGIIGCGRIGRKLIQLIKAFESPRIFVNDIDTNLMLSLENICHGVIAATKETILKDSDIISLHIPLKDEHINNTDYITEKELLMMKPNVRLLNMSRGGIINEEDLYQWLTSHPKATAAIDSFKNESYEGKLKKCGNAYLTPHIGSCTESSRLCMEMGAVNNLIKFMESMQR